MANVRITLLQTEILNIQVPIPIVNARVFIITDPTSGTIVDTKNTNSAGVCEFELAPGTYNVRSQVFGLGAGDPSLPVTEPSSSLEIRLPLGFNVTKNVADDYVDEGKVVDLTAGSNNTAINIIGLPWFWTLTAGSILDLPQNRDDPNVSWDTTGVRGIARATARISDVNGASVSPFVEINVRPGTFAEQRRPEVSVSMRRANADPSNDQALWAAIRNRTLAVRFDAYKAFIDKVLCTDPPLSPGSNTARVNRQRTELYTPIQGVGAYELLKTATQVFLLLESGLCPDNEANENDPGDPLHYNLRDRDRFVESDPPNPDPPNPVIFDPVNESTRFGRSIVLRDIPGLLQAYLGNHRLPYIQTILNNAFRGLRQSDRIFCSGYLGSRADCPPLLELIWSYWHEESMLVQTMNAISIRFQNRRGPAARDPLAHLEVAPLFPLNNLLWGYIQDEQQRLSVPRRVYEYDHHYGLTLAGKAIQDFRPADTRSKFLEAYHHLLYICTTFFKQDDDTTVIADGFPILNALKEVHLLLAEGAHNQFGDLPWTARSEMLTEQWMLSRPEMLRFLYGRDMVPYRESWMAQVDTMKRLQGWTDVTVTHFNDLAIYGEQIILSIRYGNWNLENFPAQAANWARYWRAEIQNYIHAYRAVTGVDLTAEPTTSQQRELVTMLPTMLIRQRLITGKSNPALPAPMVADRAKSFRERRANRRADAG